MERDTQANPPQPLPNHFLAASLLKSSRMPSQWWRPPKRITISPYLSGHFHCICLAKANSGWSKAITGVCSGCKWLIAFLMTSIECLIIATVCAFSRKRGNSDVMHVASMSIDCWLAWYAAHDKSLRSPALSLVDLTYSSHSHSYLIYPSLCLLKDWTWDDGTGEVLMLQLTGKTSV